MLSGRRRIKSARSVTGQSKNESCKKSKREKPKNKKNLTTGKVSSLLKRRVKLIKIQSSQSKSFVSLLNGVKSS